MAPSANKGTHSVSLWLISAVLISTSAGIWGNVQQPASPQSVASLPSMRLLCG